MSSRPVFLCILLLALFPSKSQPQDSVEKANQQPVTVDEFSSEIEHKRAEECAAKLNEWQQWSDGNWPKAQKLQADYERLQADYAVLQGQLRSQQGGNQIRRNDEPDVTVVLATFAFGAGICLMFFLIRAAKRMWSASVVNKQLIVMMLCALWITIATIINIFNEELGDHPVNLLARTFTYSLPAVLFAAISIWWYRRTATSPIEQRVESASVSHPHR